MTGLRIADLRPRKPRDKLGRYELVRELAFGRFYSVYLAQVAGEARDALSGQTVVIKRLRDAFPEPHARARMLREARVGLGMRVPQLVRVLEIHDEPELFVVMEHVEGAPLSELLARARGTDVLRCVVPVLLDALRALSALHGWKDESGAPGYLVHQAPSARHLRVGLDGVTRLVDLSNLYGRILGALPSAHYTLLDSELAPEQAARVPLDPRCDLYIVGGVLRQALTQSGRTHVAGLAEVCERALALRPSDRYWSADEMAHALHFAATEADLLAPPEQVARWVRQSRASVIAGTATTPRARMKLPAPPPALTKLVLPPLEWPPLAPDLGTASAPSSMLVDVSRAEPALGAPPLRRGEVATPSPAAPAARKRHPLDSHAKRVATAAAVLLGAGLASLLWPDAGPSRAPAVPALEPPASSPPLALPASAAPPASALTTTALHARSTPRARRVSAARASERASTPVARPAAEAAALRAPESRHAKRDAARARRAQRSTAPTSFAAERAQPEPELVLHEPQVLFYDEDDPSAEPRSE